jgi:hypothetical protein
MLMLAPAAFIAAGILALSVTTAAANNSFELWGIDQSNSAGKSFGGTVYIYDGKALARGHKAAEAVPEKIDLSLAAAALCLAKMGANPVRPHMIAMNASQSHAIISFVATGHVLIMDARTRAPIDCIRTSVGRWSSPSSFRYSLAGRILHRRRQPKRQTVRAH